MGSGNLSDICVCGHYKSDHDAWGCVRNCKCMAPYGGDEAKIAEMGDLIITNDGEEKSCPKEFHSD